VGASCASEKLASVDELTTTQILGPKLAIAGTRIGKAARYAFRLDAASIRRYNQIPVRHYWLALSSAIRAPRCRERGLGSALFPRGNRDTRCTKAATAGVFCWRREQPAAECSSSSSVHIRRAWWWVTQGYAACRGAAVSCVLLTCQSYRESSARSHAGAGRRSVGSQ
jgi:hypothetical protein